MGDSPSERHPVAPIDSPHDRDGENGCSDLHLAAVSAQVAKMSPYLLRHSKSQRVTTRTVAKIANTMI